MFPLVMLIVTRMMPITALLKKIRHIQKTIVPKTFSMTVVIHLMVMVQ